jgi:preprotein translocase subunit SecB
VAGTHEPNSEGGPAAENSHAYRRFAEAVKLNAIQVLELQAQRFDAREAPTTRFDVEAGYAIIDQGFQCEFKVKADLLASEGENKEAGQEVALCVCRLLCIYEVAEDERVGLLEDHVRKFSEGSAVLMAFPYLRENIQQLSQRLGFPGILLPQFVAAVE